MSLLTIYLYILYFFHIYNYLNSNEIDKEYLIDVFGPIMDKLKFKSIPICNSNIKSIK